MFDSKPLPLEFWHRLLARLDQEFKSRRDGLKTLMASKTATVDVAQLVIEQAARARAQVYAELSYIETIQLLIQVVSSQVRQVSFEVGVPELEQRLESMRQVVAVFSEHMCGLPSRLSAEEDLQQAVSQYGNLRNGGTGETVATERQRLRSLSREILVMGEEEGREYEAAVRNLQTTIDQWAADLQAKRVGTLLSIRLPVDLAEVLATFGVASNPVPEPVVALREPESVEQ